ncbi:GNAT family N-acetyltransferase [Streptomyces gobiensis]|uniref:GNAT family N-acetyltransferase n=1 Tax=Streptomyces gobiensis TaxID=2875706 RepID=UPI001E651A0A|nr:GNAT family N-acetyltransferase [Streptomyces gobiensis]UGY93553.1 GNAT family N-acetyltransferase [Streptomyces gobiensis]
MDIVIRVARSEELDEIGELTAEAYLGDGLLDFGEADPYLAELRDTRRRSEHAEVLVAADSRSDELLGTVAFVAEGGEYADIARPGEGEFRMLAVRPEGRGRGAGEALVRACVSRARGLGLTRLVLSSQQGMHAAHRLYGRLGFVRTPERDWEPLPGFRLWTFELDLST